MGQYRYEPRLLLSTNEDNVTDKRHLASLYWSRSHYAALQNTSVTLSWND